MKNGKRKGRHWGWRLAAAGWLALGGMSARANDFGPFPVPWPPPGTTVQPPSGPGPAGSGVPPVGTTTVPPGGSGVPPTPGPGPIVVPPVILPPTGASTPPSVPVPPGPTGAPSTPEPASAVLGMCGAFAGLLAWRRKR